MIVSRAPSATRNPIRPAQRLIPGPFPSNVGHGSSAWFAASHSLCAADNVYPSEWAPAYLTTQVLCHAAYMQYTISYLDMLRTLVYLLICLSVCLSVCPVACRLSLSNRLPTAFVTSLGCGEPSRPFLTASLTDQLVALRQASVSAEVNAVCLCESRLVPNKHQTAGHLRTVPWLPNHECYFESLKSNTASS